MLSGFSESVKLDRLHQRLLPESSVLIRPRALLVAAGGHSALAQRTHVHSSSIPGGKTIILIPAGDLVKSKVSISVAGKTDRARALTPGGDRKQTCSASVMDRRGKKEPEQSQLQIPP